MGLIVFNLMFATYAIEYEYNRRIFRMRLILMTPMVEIRGPWIVRTRQDPCPKRWAMPTREEMRWDRE